MVFGNETTPRGLLPMILLRPGRHTTTLVVPRPVVSNKLLWIANVSAASSAARATHRDCLTCHYRPPSGDDLSAGHDDLLHVYE